eukprot:gene13534-14942_t
MPEQERQLLPVVQYQVQARASARKVKFEAEANALKRLQILQQEELKLQQKKEQLKLETELAKAQAEERALAEAEGISIHDSSSVKSASRVSAWVEKIKENNNNPSNIPKKIQSTSPDKKLNPEAKEWCNNNHQEPIQLTQSAPFMQEMENLLIQQQQHTLALMLPQPELPTFGGDPIEYCNFIRSFENLIEARTDNCSARLYYLIHTTSGDVRELMSSCLSMNHNEGYYEARRLLKRATWERIQNSKCLHRQNNIRSFYTS